MILQNFGMAFSLSCSMTHVHRLQGSFLSYNKTHSSQVVRNLDVAGHTLKRHTFYAPNITWRTLNETQSTSLCLAFNLLCHSLLGYLWNTLSLGKGASTHMTFHTFAIVRTQDTMRTRKRSMMRLKVFSVGF